MTQPTPEGLTFSIDNGSPRVLTWKGDNGCRPATAEECELWDALSCSAVPPGWQSIETAPKDGTGILCFSEDLRISIQTPAYVQHHFRAGIADGDGCYYTHWMPLPAPPVPAPSTLWEKEAPPEPFMCISPACGPQCSDCNSAISARTVRDYAMRYAWLRLGQRTRQGVIMGGGNRGIEKPGGKSLLMEFQYWCSRDELDAAIDAAMASSSQPGGGTKG